MLPARVGPTERATLAFKLTPVFYTRQALGLSFSRPAFAEPESITTSTYLGCRARGDCVPCRRAAVPALPLIVTVTVFTVIIARVVVVFWRLAQALFEFLTRVMPWALAIARRTLGNTVVMRERERLTLFLPIETPRSGTHLGR